MKGIFVTIGGLGDSTSDKLDGKTPLEAAYTPNLDLLATRGVVGLTFPTIPGEVPNSEESVLSFFGNSQDETSLSMLEAIGAGIKLSEGDLVYSVNFGVIDSEGHVVDRRASRNISYKDAKKICKEINSMNFPYNFEIFPLRNEKAILVFRGNYCENVTGNDSTYLNRSGREIRFFEKVTPRDRSFLANETAEMVNEFLSSARRILQKSEVNSGRLKKGLLPVNYLFLKMPGTLKPKLNQKKNWVSCCYSYLEKGFAIASGMRDCSFNLPKFKGIDVYSNFSDIFKKACRNSMRQLRKNLDKYDYFYVHFEEILFASQDNKPFSKKAMLEYLDETFFAYVVQVATMNKIRVLVAGNKNVPCSMKRPSSDPVPFLLYNAKLPKEKITFSENEAKKSRLGRIKGNELLRRAGFF